MQWTIVCGLAIALLLWRFFESQKITRNGTRLRRPKDTLPLLGNAIRFLQPRHLLFDWFIKCQEHFGQETYEIYVPSLPPGVVVSSPENLEFVLKNEAIITKGEFFKSRSWDLFGYGIINASGDLWRLQRKAGLKFFAGSNLDDLITNVLPEAFENPRHLLLAHAKSGAVLDMQKVFLDLTTLVVGQTAYDIPIDASHPFSKAFDYASEHTSHRFQNPLYPLTELFGGKQFRSSLAVVKAFGRRIVSTAKENRGLLAFESLINNEELELGSLIDSLIETFQDPTIVADAALNFLSAGRDTTAQSMTWTLYAILRHPETLKFLEAEIREVFSSPLSSHEPKGFEKLNQARVDEEVSDNSTNGEKLRPRSDAFLNPITLSSLQPSSVPHFAALFHESLRLYPPVPFELKQVQTTTSLPDGTLLPTSSIVVWCIWAMNRSKSTWGDDAELFRPERWFENTKPASDSTPSSKATAKNDKNGSTGKREAKPKLISKTPFEYPVFNGGPRACLGKKMAEVMACYVLGRMLAEFTFEEVFEGGPAGSADEGGKIERVSQDSLTLPMKDGLPCRVRLREKPDEKRI